MKVTVELVKMIGDKLGVNWNAVSPDTLKRGTEVEMEHSDIFPDKGTSTRDVVLACRIAIGHIKERPDYYTKLADMEKSPIKVKKPEEPIVKQEYKEVIEGLVEEVLTEMHYPPKAIDFNKLPDTDGFWGWSTREAASKAGLNPLGPQIKDIGTLILWLNMTAQAWERYAKSMGKK